MNREELESLVAKLLEEAKAQGASAAEADASVLSGLSVSVRKGEVEPVENNLDRGLGVTVSPSA